MAKYWGKNYLAHGSFPEVGQKQKTEGEKRRKKERRPKVGNNNGQLRIANATSCGARKAACAETSNCSILCPSQISVKLRKLHPLLQFHIFSI